MTTLTVAAPIWTAGALAGRFVQPDATDPRWAALGELRERLAEGEDDHA